MVLDYNKTKEDAECRKNELRERLKQIPEEYAMLDREADAIKRELIGLDQILDGLDFATSDSPADFEPTGFTDKIRKILSETAIPLLPTQIRDKLEEAGVTGSSSKNLLISVHTVLGRIVGELDTLERDGKQAYIARAKVTLATLLGTESNSNHPIHHLKRRKSIGERIAEGNKTLEEYAATVTKARRDVPNPFGKNLSEMLQEPKKK
jgi:hypothetical protein